jgi:hypothetical protein
MGGVAHVSEKSCAFFREAIHEVLRAGSVVVVDLASGALQISEVIKPMEPSQDLLCAATRESDDVSGTQKAMTADLADDFEIARRNLKGRHLVAHAPEARQSPGDGE